MLHGVTEPATYPGPAVRRVRKRMGLTQQRFAEALRVTPLTVHRWETGQSHCCGH